MKTRGLPIITMGLSSILLQIISLRQLLAVFSGNELDIGITLSVWLIAVGMGSYAGHRIKYKHAFAVSFLVVGLLSQPAILLINLIRPSIPFEFGETIPLTTTIIATVISLLPLCFVIGLQFPLAVSHSGGEAAKTYSLEAAGAFIGGIVFTLLLSGKVDSFALSATISIMNLSIAAYLLRKKYLVALLLVPVIFYFGFRDINTAPQVKGLQLTERIESRYGEITVLKLGEQFNVYASGRFQFSYPDTQTEELRAHLPMAVHPSPSRILVVGGSPSVIGELLKYPVSGIDFVEMDPKIIDVSVRLLSEKDRELLNNKIVRIITEDARKFIKALRTPAYDLVILNLPEPATANINRFYTTGFFKEAKTALIENGILCLNLPASYGYIGRKMQMANGSIYNSLKNVFSHTKLSSEEYGYIFASGRPFDTNPQTLSERFYKREIETSYFQPYILVDAFSPLKISLVRERLEKIHALNTDMEPVAYLYNLMLWSEVYGGGILNWLLDIENRQIILVLMAAFIIIAAILWKKKQAVYYSMFTTGYSVMAFSMLILLAYQASFGYVYEMIGLLTAVFMLGMAFGAHITKGIQRPLGWLRLLEIAAIILFISAPVLFKQEILFYVLSFLCGMLGGMQFAAANLCIKEQDSTGVAGRLYATDLTGSFLGAFLTAIFMMPLAGVQNTLLFLVLIKGISFALLLSISHEKS
ncbi:MAG: hypothetical protein AABZ25_02755 [Nitrospirota bacterium]